EAGSHPGTPFGHDGVTTLHQDRECPGMRIQTILNRVEKFKSFVYGDVRLEERGRTGPRGADRAPEERPAVLLRLWAPGPGVRPPGREALRVRAALGHRGLPGLPDAARELCAVRGHGRDGALVRRQKPVDHDLSLVPFDLGQAAELERGR